MKIQMSSFSGTRKKTGRVFIFETLFGPSALLYRESPFAVFRTFLPRNSRSDLLADITAQGRFPEGAHPLARKVARSVIDYFKGRPLQIEWPPWPWLDLGKLTPLQQSVLEETARIPYGKTRSYRDIAAAVGRPRACRFVGSTMAKNPLPLLIPCHRVVRSDGSPGEFGGGTPLKQALLDLERRNFDKLGKS
ncbi:MAG: MGMT family protein, partial [Deltaproteobacteria bacterium]|nr:MGMT family protein [Deltaproteobacteria bacterium]